MSASINFVCTDSYRSGRKPSSYARDATLSVLHGVENDLEDFADFFADFVFRMPAFLSSTGLPSR